MSLTLGLNTALSGLLTSQRGLDVIAQNVVNVNTVGYVRKVMNPESRVLAGTGAGVQDGGVRRMVNEGLLKDIRRQSSNLGKLEVQQNYYPRVDDLFGNVADNSSISHRVQSLAEAFEVLATDISKPSIQWSAMQAGKDVTSLLNSMSTGLQNLRSEVDSEIETTVTQVNQILANIHDLNQKIVKNSAVSTGVSDLADKRDVALSELATFIDIQYISRGDGSVIVYSQGGQQLVDSQPSTLAYSASTSVDSWMTSAGGQFSKITINDDTTDITPLIQNGKLAALIELRDKTLSNITAEMDNLAYQLKSEINSVHNRGTILPTVANTFTGTRVFAEQGDVVTGVTSATAQIYLGTKEIAATGDPTATDFFGTDITWGRSGHQITMTAQSGAWPAYMTTGTTFSIDDPTNTRNSGSYKVLSNAAGVMTVEKVNVRQTMQLGGTDDVALVTFGLDGNELARTTLNAIMQTDYSGSYTSATVGDGRSLGDFTAKADRGDWTISEVSAHVEGWLRSQGYTTASANLNSDGKLEIKLNDATTSLAFRDQSSSAAGGTASDATIRFDANGDGDMDETVEGFSNFFGLNDFFTVSNQNSIYDSKIQASTYTTTVARDLTLYDGTGQLGVAMNIAAGSSLQDIADQINRYTRTTDSALQSTNSFTLTSAATITVSDSSSSQSSITLAAGTVSLAQIAGMLTNATVTASVVQDGDNYRLRVVSPEGKEMTVSITGGNMASGRTLGSQLDMQKIQPLRAAVIPEGSGQRLRIVHGENREIYASSTLGVSDDNLVSDIGLKPAATRTASTIDIRSDLQIAPEKISRGSVLWNADTGKYSVSEGDNTTALSLGAAMSTKKQFDSAGGIYSGNYTLSEYASASVSLTSNMIDQSTDGYDYQKTLNASLEFQYTSFSGVNLDEEVAAMIDFQQAYSAAAKVISVLQEMLETLTGMIR